MEITKLVEKIEKELDLRSVALDKREAALWQKSSELEALRLSTETRLAEVTEREAEIEAKLEKIAKVEAKLKDEKEVEKEREEAIAARNQAEIALKAIKEKEGDINTSLADLSKRELALSARESTYKDEVKKEFMEKFLAR